MFTRLLIQDGIRALEISYSYDHRTQLPYILVFAAIFSLYAYKYAKQEDSLRAQTISFLVYQFSVFILIISISRGPWVALSGVLLPVFIFHSAIRGSIIEMNILGVSAGIGAAVYFDQVDRLMDRVTSTLQPGDPETIGRFEIYQNAINVMAENPLLGIGWNNYSVVFNISGSAHSTYLTIGSELGMPSFVMYLAVPVTLSLMWIRVVRGNSMDQSARLQTLAPLAGTLGLLVGQTFSTALLWFRSFWVAFALAISGAVIATDLHKDR
jgi:O-antigen ligase